MGLEFRIEDFRLATSLKWYKRLCRMSTWILLRDSSRASLCLANELMKIRWYVKLSVGTSDAFSCPTVYFHNLIHFLEILETFWQNYSISRTWLLSIPCSTYPMTCYAVRKLHYLAVFLVSVTKVSSEVEYLAGLVVSVTKVSSMFKVPDHLCWKYDYKIISLQRASSLAMWAYILPPFYRQMLLSEMLPAGSYRSTITTIMTSINVENSPSC